MKEPLIFKEDYTGPVWVYGLTNRPAGFGATPDGRIVGGDSPKGEGNPFRWGTIEYARQLTKEEVEGYELVLFKSGDGSTDRDRFRAMLPEMAKPEMEGAISMYTDAGMYVVLMLFNSYGRFCGARVQET